MIGSQSVLNVNGVDLSLIERGDGQLTLLFLHYWTGSSLTWSDTIDQLSKNYRCLALDFRGWGDSQKGALDYGLDALASDVLAVISKFGLTNFVLIGHSMGGKVAQIVATHKPAGLKGLLLVAPAPPTPLNKPKEEREFVLSNLDSREGVEAILPILAHKALKSKHRELVIANTVVGDPLAKRSWCDSGMGYDLTQQTSSVAVPIHVVVGGKDGVETETSLRVAFDMYYPGTTYSVIPDVGHLIPLEASDELASIIDSKYSLCD